MRFLIVLFVLGFCFSCIDSNNNNNNNKEEEELVSVEREKVLLSYAENFSVEKEGELTILTIHSAWKNSTEAFQYVLYPRDKKAPEGFEKAIKVAVPLEKVICTSTIDIAFLDFIESTDKIVALANGAYVYNTEVRQAITDGAIQDIGGSNAIDYEKALLTGAEAAFVYSIGDKSTYSKFNEMGIAPIMLSDFMETSPLGRAEWTLFVAHFFGLEEEAKKKYAEMASKYTKLKMEAKLFSYMPSVLTGAVYKGTWHVAGGKSLMATFIKDAGAHYLWAENEEVSGVPLDFEAVYVKGIEADYWINMSHMQTQKALGDSESKYSDFKAFQEGNIFNYYKRSLPNGGSDIFESAIVNPHLILKDLIQIFHRKDIKEDDLYYYKRLQ